MKMMKNGLLGTIGFVMLMGFAAPSLAQMPADTQFLNDIRDRKYGETLPYLINGGTPDARDYNGVPAIVAAAEIGDAGMVKELLKYGANPNLVNKADGMTALHKAAMRGSEVIISLLVLEGGTVDAWDRLGETPLIKAVKEGHIPAAKMLLSVNASPDMADYSGHSAYDHAMRSRDHRMRKLFK